MPLRSSIHICFKIIGHTFITSHDIFWVLLVKFSSIFYNINKLMIKQIFDLVFLLFNKKFLIVYNFQNFKIIEGMIVFPWAQRGLEVYHWFYWLFDRQFVQNVRLIIYCFRKPSECNIIRCVGAIHSIARKSFILCINIFASVCYANFLLLCSSFSK